jgi:hypothetical protein
MDNNDFFQVGGTVTDRHEYLVTSSSKPDTKGYAITIDMGPGGSVTLNAIGAKYPDGVKVGDVFLVKFEKIGARQSDAG